MIAVFKKISPVFFVLVILSACDPSALRKSEGRLDYLMFKGFQHKITPLPNYGEQKFMERPVIEKNYSVGNQNVAFMGQPMVRFKMHVKESYRSGYNKVRTSDNVILRGGSEDIYIKRDVIYEIIGSMEVSGETFDVMQIKPSEGVLINRNGTFLGKVVTLDRDRVHLIEYNFIAQPSNVRIISAVSERDVDVIPMSDFEIIYSGIRDEKFYITLMDNTKAVYNANYDKIGVQSGVYQTFAYDKSTSLINVAGMDIRVLGVHSDKIDFIVVNEPNFVSEAFRN